MTWPSFINDCIAQFVTYVTNAGAAATSAAASAVTATNSVATQGTSTTSLTIGTGAQTLTIQTGKGFLPGMPIRIAKNDGSLNWMDGSVTSYSASTGALVANIRSITGSGTFSTWNVFLEGAPTSVNGTSVINNIPEFSDTQGTIQDSGKSLVSFSNTGDCRLSLVSSNLVLKPFNGNQIVIAGFPRTIPSAGVSLAPTGLSGSTLYYIYAYMVGSVVTLNASTTAHATDTTTGVEVMSGNSAYTLVGMAYCQTAATFTDTATNRLVLSYFNRRNITCKATNSGGTASAPWVNLLGPIYYLSWGDSDVMIGITATGSHTITGGYVYVGYSIDSATSPSDSSSAEAPAPSYSMDISVPPSGYRLTEGYHYSAGLGGTYSSAATYIALNLSITIEG